MSTTISFKVSKEVKEKMEAYSSRIRWAEELRRYLLKRIEELEREEAIKKVEELLKSVRPAPIGTAVKMVREDREGH